MDEMVRRGVLGRQRELGARGKAAGPEKSLADGTLWRESAARKGGLWTYGKEKEEASVRELVPVYCTLRGTSERPRNQRWIHGKSGSGIACERSGGEAVVGERAPAGDKGRLFAVTIRLTRPGGRAARWGFRPWL